jgi:hypothetical protein
VIRGAKPDSGPQKQPAPTAGETLVRGELQSPALRLSLFAGTIRKQIGAAFTRLGQVTLPA